MSLVIEPYCWLEKYFSREDYRQNRNRLPRFALQAENARHAILIANVAKHDEAIANLERHWQACLSTIQPC